MIVMDYFGLRLVGVLIALFAVLAIIKTVDLFRKDKLTTRLLLVWVILWSSIGFFALFPILLDQLMRLVNMGDRLFFLTTTSILILYILIFHITASLSQTNRKITKLAQEITIINHKLEEKIN